MDNSFVTWIEKHKNISFRYWVHKKMFTPYEVDLKDENQSCTDSEECNYGYITDYTILPNNDVMIGFSEDKVADYIAYYKLSEIEINYCKSDNEEE